MCFTFSNEIINNDRGILSFFSGKNGEPTIILVKTFAVKRGKLISPVTETPIRFKKDGWVKKRNRVQDVNISIRTKSITNPGGYAPSIFNYFKMRLGYHAYIPHTDYYYLSEVLDNNKLHMNNNLEENGRYNRLFILSRPSYVQLINSDEIVVKSFRFPTEEELNLIERYINQLKQRSLNEKANEKNELYVQR